jgi:DNA-binding beta-propeller fold protein YncE
VSRRSSIVAAAILCLLAFGGAARADQFLTLAASIPLPGVSGRIDHMAVDLARKRLFVAEYGNDTLDVVDLAAGQRIRRVRGLDEPQGVGYAPRADVVAVSNGGGTVRLYRGGDLAPLAEVALGRDADNLRVDPRTGDVLVAHGDGGIAIIDPARRMEIDNIGLPTHPESFQLDTRTRRIFANLPRADQIAVIDLAAKRQIARWRVPGLRDNFPMALDSADNRLAIVFWHPPKLVLLDPQTGAVRAELPACADADDAYFDGKRDRLYVSCGAGAVDVFARGVAGRHRLSAVRTAPGARTSLFVPALNRLYVAAPARFGAPARILVFRPLP